VNLKKSTVAATQLQRLAHDNSDRTYQKPKAVAPTGAHYEHYELCEGQDKGCPSADFVERNSGVSTRQKAPRKDTLSKDDERLEQRYAEQDSMVSRE